MEKDLIFRYVNAIQANVRKMNSLLIELDDKHPASLRVHGPKLEQWSISPEDAKYLSTYLEEIAEHCLQTAEEFAKYASSET